MTFKSNKGTNVKKKAKHDSDLAKMREKFKKGKAREEGGGGGGDSNRLTLAVGANNVYVLPRPGVSEFYVEAPIHFGIGATGAPVRCIGTLDESGRVPPHTNCPICKKFLRELAIANKKYERGSEKGKEAWSRLKQAWHPKVQYFANVLTEDRKVKILRFGEQILMQLLELWMEDGATVGNFTDPETGRWLNIKRIGSDKLTKYKVYASDDASGLEKWEKIKKKLHDLEAAAGEKLTAEQLKELMSGADGDDDDDDGPPKRSKKKASRDEDEEDEEDEDEDEDEEDEDEDEDEEDEDEDEEDEEEEEPVRKKKKGRRP